jgi:hypothetical protein
VDIWAAGILAYELLVGKPPFEVQDEHETRKRIMYETTLTFPPHVSADAMSFIKTALAKNAATRPDAAAMLHHPWLRPHVAAAAAAAAATAAPPLDCKAAAIAALRGAALGGATAAVAAVPHLAAVPAAPAGGMGRSASFSSVPATAAAALKAPLARPGGLLLPAGDGLLPPAYSACGGSLSASAGFGALAHVPPSPTASDAPATPGPWLGGRKPVWEADALPVGAFTAGRTAGLAGDAPPSPSSAASATTSPGRSKLSGIAGASVGPGALAAALGGGGFGSPGGGGGGGGNPLLKAALNSNLYKLSHVTQAPGAGHVAAGGGASGAHAPANIKARIKDYFVARSTNEASKGGGTLT